MLHYTSGAPEWFCELSCSRRSTVLNSSARSAATMAASMPNRAMKPYCGKDSWVIGPMVMSYLAVKPGNEMKQCSPCPGPREVRLRGKWGMVSVAKWKWCNCDGNGMCRWSLEDAPLGPRQSRRCTCIKDCVRNMKEERMMQQQQKFRNAWVAKAVIVAWVISQRGQRR